MIGDNKYFIASEIVLNCFRRLSQILPPAKELAYPGHCNVGNFMLYNLRLCGRGTRFGWKLNSGTSPEKV